MGLIVGIGLLYPFSSSLLPIHCLSIHSWVPVRVVENNSVGRGQIDTKPPRSRTQHKDECVATLRLEVIYLRKIKKVNITSTMSVPDDCQGLSKEVVTSHHVSPIGNACTSVQSHISVLSVPKEILKDVHHLGHLAEHQHPACACE